MRLDLRKFKIEKAALRNSGFDRRAQIAQPYLDVEAGSLVATDSYVLAIVPVEIEAGDASGPVPTAALTEARKRTKGKHAQSQLALNGRAEIDGGDVSFKRPEIDKFIDWQKVANTKAKPVAVFGLNPRKLLQVAEAIGCDKDGFLKIEFYGYLKPLHVSHASGGRGVVMPVRVEDGMP